MQQKQAQQKGMQQKRVVIYLTSLLQPITTLCQSRSFCGMLLKIGERIHFEGLVDDYQCIKTHKVNSQNTFTIWVQYQ